MQGMARIGRLAIEIIQRLCGENSNAQVGSLFVVLLPLHGWITAIRTLLFASCLLSVAPFAADDNYLALNKDISSSLDGL